MQSHYSGGALLRFTSFKIQMRPWVRIRQSCMRNGDAEDFSGSCVRLHAHARNVSGSGISLNGDAEDFSGSSMRLSQVLLDSAWTCSGFLSRRPGAPRRRAAFPGVAGNGGFAIKCADSLRFSAPPR